MSTASPITPGLTSAEAERYLAEHPPRQGPRGSRSFADIVWSNTFTLFNLILIVLLVPLAIFGLWADMLFGGVLVANMAIGIIQETGTAIGEALAMGVDRMKTVKGKGSKVIILLTDGDDNQSKAILPIPAAELTAAMGIKLYTIGLGKDEPTVLPQFDRRTGKLNRDVFGKIIPMMTMNPANLDRLAVMCIFSMMFRQPMPVL